MASQQVVFKETIIAMKKARKRRAYESDSDSEIDNHGNRGRKLQKKARFAHQGQLAPPGGPEFYREIVNHAGYHRTIISRNPPLLDDEGYELNSSDDEDLILDVANAAAEFDPYSNIRLENILAPLTAVTDLPTHPTLSRPYTSKTLTELTKQGCNIMQKENAALWRVKHLQTKIIGDHTWAPCELMIGPNDIDLYRDDYVDQAQGSVKSEGSVRLLEHGPSESKANGQHPANGEDIEEHGDADVGMADAETRQDVNSSTKTKSNNAKGKGRDKKEMRERSTERSGSLEHDEKETGSSPSKAVNGVVTNGTDKSGDVEMSDAQNQEAAKQLTNEENRPMSINSETSNDVSIHPIFLPPRSARPDRDLGIPESEAEDMRRMLQLYVQKQEEVCRGTKRLYEGLLRADRMRKTVLSWSKHEAHVGPNRDMSDGEDWYDKEEWGLEEDLKKGADEEEEETPQTTKKTRTRR
ncbi:RXT2-like protein [Xylariaceae sp. FL1272]|nr:RXT2-like protein [Xylariaceae sp. FL1272]